MPDNARLIGNLRDEMGQEEQGNPGE